MLKFLEEMIARLFGQRQEQPIRVRVEEGRPQDRIFKGRK